MVRIGGQGVCFVAYSYSAHGGYAGYTYCGSLCIRISSNVQIEGAIHHPVNSTTTYESMRQAVQAVTLRKGRKKGREKPKAECRSCGLLHSLSHDSNHLASHNVPMAFGFNKTTRRRSSTVGKLLLLAQGVSGSMPAVEMGQR